MTTARLLTPMGRGAIAVVEVLGPEAVAVVEHWFDAANDRPLIEQPVAAIRFGRWRREDGAPGEELVVIRTSEDRVEVHCHGGAAAPTAILRGLEEHGVQPLADADGSLAEQARRALAEAPTERTAAILLDQANGALGHAIHAIVEQTERGDHAAAEAGLNELLSHERLGCHLTRPWRVVLAGPPNVGKSSLINALVGYDRALVYDRPGTTRDVVTAVTAVEGWPVTLADTAGVRETDDPLESAGVRLTRDVLVSAEAVVLVGEAARLTSTEGKAERARLHAQVAEAATIIEVANKSDLAPADWAAPAGVVVTNARAGEGIDALLAAVASALAVRPPAPGTAVPFRAEHFALLGMALSAPPAERATLLRALLAGE